MVKTMLKLELLEKKDKWITYFRLHVQTIFFDNFFWSEMFACTSAPPTCEDA